MNKHQINMIALEILKAHFEIELDMSSDMNSDMMEKGEIVTNPQVLVRFDYFRDIFINQYSFAIKLDEKGADKIIEIGSYLPEIHQAVLKYIGR